MINQNSKANINDVAKLANVSIATVSRVINQTGQVAATTKQKVWNAIEELNYVPERAAQHLANRKTNTIGLLFSDVSGDFFDPLIRGIEEAARRLGYELLIYCVNDEDINNEDSPVNLLPLGKQNTDGLIIFSNSISTKQVMQLKKSEHPFVMVYQKFPADTKVPYVIAENYASTYEIIEHLIKVHGSKRIGFLSGPSEQEDTNIRKKAYLQCLQDNHISIDQELIGYGGFARLIAREQINKWIATGLEIDAIFTGDDESAIGVYSALQNHNLHISEDVKVVGFDDMPMAEFLFPQLTTVKVPTEKIGGVAIEKLIKIINNEKFEIEEILPTQVVIRKSCGCQ